MYRDFSEKSKLQLLQLVSQVEDEKLCNFTDWVGDRWYDFESWIGKLNIRNYINNVNTYHRKVIDKNNTTKSAIESIFEKVKAADTQYCVNLTDKCTQLKLWEGYIKELGGIVNPANGRFTTEYITSSMDKKLEEYREYIHSSERPENEIYSKLIGFDFTELFLNSRDTGKDALAIGWTSDFLKNITSFIGVGDNVNEIHMRKSIESVIAEILKHKHEMTDFYEDYTDALMPEELETQKKIIKNFVKTGKIYTKEELANLLKMDVSEFDESKIAKWINQGLLQEDNLEFLNKISNKIDTTLGAYGDAVETLDISSQILTKVFNDYTEDTKYLEAIKQALIDGGYDNKTVNGVVDSMLWEYRNQYISAVHDGIEKLAEKAVDKGLDKVMDKAVPYLGVFLDTKDITSSVIGLTETTDDIASVYATQQYSYALVEKYDFYRQKINSGTYTKNDIEQCDIFYKLAKQAKLQEYKAIKKVTEKALNSGGAIFSSDEDKQYTRDVIAEINVEIEKLENV